MTMTVLINAGPWLPVPPPGYGGIENVLAALIPELRRRGVRVVLAGVGASTVEVDELISVYPDPQFGRLQQPYNRTMGVAAAHLARVAAELHHRDDITLLHDHQEAFGLAVPAAMGGQAPPVLHTLHWDLTKHPELYSGLPDWMAGPAGGRAPTGGTGTGAAARSHTVEVAGRTVARPPVRVGGGRVWVNGVSFAQLTTAPAALRRISVGHVHLATPLAVDAHHRPAVPKAGHLIVLGRITAVKGQHTAARLAHRIGRDLVLAGPVGPHHTPEQLTAATAASSTGRDLHPDVRYWQEQVAPLVDGRRVHWIGTVAGRERDALLASATAALFPIGWDEPGGTAVVESLALGTPVVGFRRGCLPELVEHGRTGLLVDPDDDTLAAAVSAADALDPDDARREAARRFTPSRMADKYLRLYRKVLTRSGDRPSVTALRTDRLPTDRSGPS